MVFSELEDDDHDEYAKLIRRMNPPRVVIDNEVSQTETVIKVDSVNKHGILLQVIQVLTDLNLIVNKAYMSSDGSWFMDVFNVTDRDKNKVKDETVLSNIKSTLESAACFFPELRNSVGITPSKEHTFIELTGTDRPGLLSEICAVLTDKRCKVVQAELWTHNTRVAAVVHVTDETTAQAIEEPERLSTIKELLCNVLKGHHGSRTGKMTVSTGVTHTQRRLHQMMFDDRDYEEFGTHAVGDDKAKHEVSVTNCPEKGYSVVIIRTKDRPKLLFDTVCTLTDMQYVVFHGTVSTGNGEAYQEYYIRHMDGFPVRSEAEQNRVIKCLEAAIERRTSEGLELELRIEDRAGLLSDVTRILRENGLTIRRAEISTYGGEAVDRFYVTDSSGSSVEARTLELITRQLGQSGLKVKQAPHLTSKPTEVASFIGFTFMNLFKAPLQSFKLIRSYT